MDTIEKDEEFYNFISKNKPIIILFSTHDCATCPQVEKRITENFSDIDKRKIYLDDMLALRGSLSIFNTPVVCIYVESKKFARFIRIFSISKIKTNRLLEFI